MCGGPPGKKAKRPPEHQVRIEDSVSPQGSVPPPHSHRVRNGPLHVALRALAPHRAGPQGAPTEALTLCPALLPEGTPHV